MPNLRRTPWQSLRTRLWAAAVADQLGIHNGKRIEMYLSARTGHQAIELSGVFSRYLAGKSMPSRTVGPVVSGPWLDRVDTLLPGTSDWFRSPVWFLLEERSPSFAELLECIQLLPEELQAQLLSDNTKHLPPQYRFRLPSEGEILWIMPSIAAWHFGALACVFRTADAKGNERVARRALLSLLQAMDLRLTLFPDGSQVKAVLINVRQAVGEYVHQWLTTTNRSLTSIDLHEHTQEHQEFEWECMRRRSEFTKLFFRLQNEELEWEPGINVVDLRRSKPTSSAKQAPEER